MDLSYQNRIPEATKDNIANIYRDLLNISPLRNEFTNALVTMVMIQRIESTFFKNPLGVLKKEPLRYGMTEEEIFVNMAKGYQFNQFATVNDLYAFYKANVMAAYHKLSPAMQYAVTITFDNLRTAFTNEYGIKSLINAKVESLYSSAEWDEYICMKEIIESAYNAGHMYPVHVDDITSKDKGEEFTIVMKEYIDLMKFPNPAFNIAGATSAATDNTIFYMITPGVNAKLDVKVLQNAFNLGKVDFNVKKIVIDKFENPAIKAVLFDMRFFNVRENFKTMSDSKNGAALTWNYFYTISEMFSYSPFFPVIVFTTENITSTEINAINVTNVKKGADVEIKANVTGTGYVPQALEFEVANNTSAYTAFIPGSNVLHIANDEMSATLNVIITSRYDSDIKKNITVTIN